MTDTPLVSRPDSRRAFLALTDGAGASGTRSLDTGGGSQSPPALSRRRFLQAAGGVGVLVVGARLWLPTRAWAAGPTTTGTGTTPEQVHLTWAFDATNNPTNAVVVNWLQPQPSTGGFVIYAPTSVGTPLALSEA